MAIAPSSVIIQHGIDEFLKPFVEDVKRLNSSGINLRVNGTVRHFCVGLLAFLADNLAAHMLGGFKESMSFAFRICRTCMATKEQSQTYFLESQFKLRTAREHKHHCQKLEGALGNHYSVSFGINQQSILESINDFSVVRNLPHDIMHDLFEGVLIHELKALLFYFCIHSKLFIVKVLNYQ